MISKNLWEIVYFNYFKILDFHIAENNVNNIKKKKKRKNIYDNKKINIYYCNNFIKE